MEHPLIACGPHDRDSGGAIPRRPLVIYGIGALARTTLKMIREQGLADVVAFCVDRRFLEGGRVGEGEGLPVVAFEEVAERFPPDRHDMLVLIGYKRMRDREVMFRRAKERGYRLPNLIAPTSRLAGDLELGENNIIGDFVFVGPESGIGNNVIIRPATHIGHNTRIEDHVFIAPGCMIASACRIGELSYLGIGVTIVEKVTLGREALVVAGSVVCSDVDAQAQVRGNPAEKVGAHPETGILILR
ncbi:MAG: hypothetical protein KAY32_04555 [Candidatus Eisenbacteria sp.]|nr:hypothetical protein [Candidatus Eisenbacteria bacterium]